RRTGTCILECICTPEAVATFLTRGVAGSWASLRSRRGHCSGRPASGPVREGLPFKFGEGEPRTTQARLSGGRLPGWPRRVRGPLELETNETDQSAASRSPGVDRYLQEGKEAMSDT